MGRGGGERGGVGFVEGGVDGVDIGGDELDIVVVQDGEGVEV